MSKTFDNRPYQNDAASLSMKSLLETGKALLVAATGTGKTYIAMLLLKLMGFIYEDTLVITPHLAINAQFAQLGLEAVTPQEAKKRLNQGYCPKILICDEAHRLVSPMANKTIREFESRGALILGLTATPDRLDGVSLADTFGQPVYTYGIRRAIADGMLVPFIPLTPKGVGGLIAEGKLPEGTDLNISTKVYNPKGAKSEKEDVMSSYIRFIEVSKRRSLCFFRSQEEANLFVKLANEAGVKAIATLAGDENEKVFREDSTYTILAGVTKVLEGFDDPSIESIYGFSPTDSVCRAVQAAGRGIRRCDEIGKDSCWIKFVPTKSDAGLANKYSVLIEDQTDKFDKGTETAINRMIKVGNVPIKTICRIMESNQSETIVVGDYTWFYNKNTKAWIEIRA